MARKKLDNWTLKGGGSQVDGMKVGFASKPTRILPKQAKLKALDKSLHTTNDYSKLHPIVDVSDPIPTVLQHMRKRR